MGFDNLYNQVSQQILGQTTQNPSDLNPKFISTSTQQFRGINNTPTASVSSTYPWTVRYTTKPILVPPGLLDDTTFATLGVPLASYTYMSQNGNLSISNLTPNTIYSFSANVFRYTSSASTLIYLPWASYLTLLMNGSPIIKTSANVTPSVNITLNKGETDITIYIGTF